MDYQNIRSLIEDSDSEEGAARAIAFKTSMTLHEARQFLGTPLGQTPEIAAAMFPEWFG